MRLLAEIVLTAVAVVFGFLITGALIWCGIQAAKIASAPLRWWWR